jgi:hypothetical protein
MPSASAVGESFGRGAFGGVVAVRADPCHPFWRRAAGTNTDAEVNAVWTWIVILVLYVVEIALFRLLGGTGSAGEAFRQWGDRATRTLSANSGHSG